MSRPNGSVSGGSDPFEKDSKSRVPGLCTIPTSVCPAPIVPTIVSDLGLTKPNIESAVRNDQRRGQRSASRRQRSTDALLLRGRLAGGRRPGRLHARGRWCGGWSWRRRCLWSRGWSRARGRRLLRRRPLLRWCRLLLGGLPRPQDWPGQGFKFDAHGIRARPGRTLPWIERGQYLYGNLLRLIALERVGHGQFAAGRTDGNRAGRPAGSPDGGFCLGARRLGFEPQRYLAGFEPKQVARRAGAKAQTTDCESQDSTHHSTFSMLRAPTAHPRPGG